MMFGRLFSFWNGPFPGDMLIFGGDIIFILPIKFTGLAFWHQCLCFCCAWAPSLDFHKVQTLFRNLDASEDGAISKEEFSKLVESPMLQFWMGQLELEYHDTGLGSFFSTRASFLNYISRVKSMKNLQRHHIPCTRDVNKEYTFGGWDIRQVKSI